MHPKLLAMYAAFLKALRGESFSMNTSHWTETAPSVDALGGGVAGRARQAQTIITGIVIVIVATLAVVIVASFNNSVSVNESDNPELSSALDSVNSGFADMLGLVGPLLLVLITVVIIAVVRRLQ